MGQDFRSANWYRVAAVRPRLAPHVQAQRQRYQADHERRAHGHGPAQERFEGAA